MTLSYLKVDVKGIIVNGIQRKLRKTPIFTSKFAALIFERLQLNIYQLKKRVIKLKIATPVRP